MTIVLRPYQLAAKDALWNYLANRDGNPALVLPTGAGKSPLMAGIVRDAVEQWQGRVMVVAHVQELVAQNADKLRRLWPEAPVGIYAAGLKRRDRFEKIIYAQIQSVADRAHSFGHVDLLLIDEAHRIPLRGEGRYLKFITGLKKINPRLRVIGLTATPYRLQGQAVPVCGPDHVLTEVAYEARIAELIEGGYLSRLTSRAGERPDLGGVHTRGGEYVEAELADAMMRDDLVERTVADMLARAAGRRAGIVFCVNVAHAEAVLAALRAAGETAELVHGATPKGERERRIEAFQSGRTRWMVNVNVLSEGFDAPMIDVVAMLRPTKSPGLYYQQCLDEETEILTRRGWVGIDFISEDDEVAAADYSAEVPVIEWQRPSNITRRPLGDDEEMFHVSGPGVDMRVTGGHSIVLAGRRSDEGWKKVNADRVARKKSDYRIPVAGIERAEGAPLTDDEIRFIGWVMTDGNINKHTRAITISQSSAQPWFDEIERMLIGCGFKYAKRLITAKTQFNETAPRYTFIVSHGKPRGTDKHLRGWGSLEPYISKDFAERLHELDERQFSILLEAIHLGDGAKQTSAPWTRRSYHIVSANPAFIDRLQSLCLRRGWRCNIAPSRSRDSRIFVAHIKRQHYRSVGGNRQVDRDHLQRSDTTVGERVWCVTVAHGAFIARRNGKAFITGNCGRGFRLHPGKDDCLVLDYAGNMLEHGPVDAIRVRPARGKKAATVETTKAKECPGCAALLAIGVRECPECGHSFASEDPAHLDRPVDAPILAGDVERKIVRLPVNGTKYERWPGKNGKPPTLRVTYQCGLRRVSEFVCLEHGGYARGKALAWWIERSDRRDVPRTVEEALGRCWTELRVPCEITVDDTDKYPSVLSAALGERAAAEPQPVDEGAPAWLRAAMERKAA